MVLRYVLPINLISLPYVVDNCFRKIFDIKLKQTVEECMREFNVLTVNDAIDARKRNS